MPKVRIDEAFASKEMKKLLRRHPDKRKKVLSTLQQLGDDPRYPSLSSKKYDASRGIWQSYIENNTPGAWRVWWQWDSDEPDTIIVLSFGPHPK